MAAKKFNGKTYRKAVARIDRVLTWDRRYNHEESTSWWWGTCSHIHVMKPGRYWMSIVICRGGKSVWWHCESYADINRVLHMIEFMCM